MVPALDFNFRKVLLLAGKKLKFLKKGTGFPTCRTRRCSFRCRRRTFRSPQRWAGDGSLRSVAAAAGTAAAAGGGDMEGRGSRK